MTNVAGRGAFRCLLLGLGGVLTWAGPPFRTDDPQPVDLGHLEVYLFTAGQRLPGGSSGVGPAVELNLGILPDTQFHIGIPYAYAHPLGSAAQSGPGDVEIGFKHRIVQETDARPQVGLFPLVVLPTGRSESGLGSGHTQVYLPLWVQKSWGPWTTYGGHGWWRNPGPGNRNWSYSGWLLQRDLGPRLTLGMELFHSSPTTPGGPASNGFNAGGQVNLSETHHLLFSAGRSFAGGGQATFYLGYQVTAGPLAGLGEVLSRGRAPG